MRTTRGAVVWQLAQHNTITISDVDDSMASYDDLAYGGGAAAAATQVRSGAMHCTGDMLDKRIHDTSAQSITLCRLGSLFIPVAPQDAFCMACFRPMRVSAADTRCPSCALPLRRLSPELAARVRQTVDAMTARHLRDMASGRDLRRGDGGDAAGRGTDDNDDSDDHDAGGGSSGRPQGGAGGALQSDGHDFIPFGGDIEALLMQMLGGERRQRAEDGRQPGTSEARASEDAAHPGDDAEARAPASGTVNAGSSNGENDAHAGSEAQLLQTLLQQLGLGFGVSPAPGLGLGEGAGFEAADTAALAAALMAGANEAPARPAAPAAVAALKRLPIPAGTANVSVLLPQQCSVRVAGVAADFVAVPAGFGPRVPAGTASAARVAGPLVLVDPIDAAAPGAPRNAAALRGAIALVHRGVTSFAAKALKLAAAGAVGVIVVQTADVWPYTMNDSAGEAAAGNLTIPVVMVRKEDGNRLASVVAARRETGSEPPHATLLAQPAHASCSVCCDDFAAGNTLIFMPCQHAFHEGCLTAWLARQPTCPLCRSELPEAEVEGGAEPGAAVGRPRWAAERRLAAEREAMAATWYS